MLVIPLSAVIRTLVIRIGEVWALHDLGNGVKRTYKINVTIFQMSSVTVMLQRANVKGICASEPKQKQKRSQKGNIVKL